MKRLLLLFSATLLLCSFLNAQVQKQSNIDRCGTMQHLQWMQQQDPSLKQWMDTEEQKFNNYIASHSAELKSSKASYTIPVVVHVVYKNTSIGFVNALQVQEQINQTNMDWGGLNPHPMAPFTDSLKADAGITLCLASMDPSGNATTGIDYVQTTVTSFSTDDKVKHASTGGANAWDPTKYLNIWVCNLGMSLCGYAQFPSSGINNTYGVVIHYQYFGLTGAVAPYNGGGTMSHELSHCFNLFHLTSDVSCADMDGCPDTPDEYGTQSLMGNCVVDQCNPACPGIMFMNFMAYSDDSTYANLTPDQGARMQACVQTYLMSVANNSSTACSVQTPCTSYFYLYPDSTTLHHYYAVNMANGSGPLTYFWNWGDGSFDTIAYPSHLYDSAGYYNICLTISDTTGCTSTYCDSSYYIQKSGNSIVLVDVIPQGSVGVHEIFFGPNFNLYPNPAENSITVENIYSVSAANAISIYDMHGSIMLRKKIKNAKTVIDVSTFAKGLYVVKLESGSGVGLMKFVKE